jgi:hypothetical protein
METLPTVDLNKYNKPIIEPYKKQTHFCIGFTGSSKSTTLEKIAEELLDKGQTGFDCYGGEFHENAYWSITMGCCHDDDYPCECGTSKDGNKMGYDTDYGRYPMTLLVPDDFILTDKFGNESELPLQNYNDNRFSLWEWKRYLAQKGYKGLIEYDHKSPPQRLQGKPKVPWIKFVKLPKPKHSQSKKGMWDSPENSLIREIFLRELEFSRDEGQKRVVSFNIGFWPIEFRRMKTIQILIYSLQLAKEKVFLPPPIFDKPKSEWTSREKTYDRIFMLFRELGEVANAQFKTDEGGYSTFIKRALGWYIRKGRQLGCSMIGDMQRTEDVMPGIRTHADWFLIKNSPLSMLGETWQWFIDKLTEERQKMLDETNWNYKKVNDKYPRIQDLSKAWGYAVSSSDVFHLINFKMPKHHHWDPDHGDHWKLITGIHWKFEDTITSDSSDTTEAIDKPKIHDNTIEQVTIIQAMLANPKLKKAAIKEYKLESINNKWTWKNFTFPIYQEWIARGTITTSNVRPTPIALSVWFNRVSKPSA